MPLSKIEESAIDQKSGIGNQKLCQVAFRIITILTLLSILVTGVMILRKPELEVETPSTICTERVNADKVTTRTLVVQQLQGNGNNKIAIQSDLDMAGHAIMDVGRLQLGEPEPIGEKTSGAVLMRDEDGGLVRTTKLQVDQNGNFTFEGNVEIKGNIISGLQVEDAIIDLAINNPGDNLVSGLTLHSKDVVNGREVRDTFSGLVRSGPHKRFILFDSAPVHPHQLQAPPVPNAELHVGSLTVHGNILADNVGVNNNQTLDAKVDTALYSNKGDLLTRKSESELDVLTIDEASDDDVLSVAKGDALGLRWKTPTACVPIDSYEDAGDMVVGTGEMNNKTRKISTLKTARSQDGDVLTVSKGDGLGLKWKTPTPCVSLESYKEVGDLVVGTGDGYTAIGTLKMTSSQDGTVLTVSKDSAFGLAWEPLPATVPDIATQLGDMLVGTGKANDRYGVINQGTPGQVLACGEESELPSWKTPTPCVPLSSYTSKGDLAVGTSEGAVKALQCIVEGVNDGDVLTVSKTSALGLTWEPLPAAITLESAGGTETLVHTGVGRSLKTKGLTAGPGGISLTGAATSVTIGNTLTCKSLGGTAAAAVFVNKTGELLNMRGITAGAGITVSQNPNNIIIENADGASMLTLKSAGGSETLIKNGIGPDLVTKGLTAGTGGISLTGADASVTIENTLTCKSLGGTAAAAVFVDKTGENLNMRGIIAGTGITVTQRDNEIEIAAETGNKFGVRYYIFEVNYSAESSVDLDMDTKNVINHGNIFENFSNTTSQLKNGGYYRITLHLNIHKSTSTKYQLDIMKGTNAISTSHVYISKAITTTTVHSTVIASFENSDSISVNITASGGKNNSYKLANGSWISIELLSFI